jgi:hypothetical protein
MSAVRRKTTTVTKSKKAPGPRKPRSTRSSASASKPTYEQIAERAYYIWESRGSPWGQSLENWLEAERQLKL